MKFKDSIAQYLNDLPNRWSANFLALLGSVNIVLVIITALVTAPYEKYSIITVYNLIKFIKSFISDIFFYEIFLFIVSCFLTICIIIPYILTILSKNRSFIIINILVTLSFFISFLILNHFASDISGRTAIFSSFLLVNIFSVPILVIIYLILLIIEHFLKFRIKENLVLKSPVFKKYVKIFYCYSLLVIFSLLAGGLYLLVT